MDFRLVLMHRIKPVTENLCLRKAVLLTLSHGVDVSRKPVPGESSVKENGVESGPDGLIGWLKVMQAGEEAQKMGNKWTLYLMDQFENVN